MPARPPSIDAVLAALPEAVVVIAPDGTIALANASAEALLGRAAAELTGRPLATLLPADAEVAESRVDGHRVLVVRRPQGERAEALRRQAAIAALGQHALTGAGLPELMQEAARTLAEVLEADRVEVLELLAHREFASSLAVPMVVAGREIGAIAVHSRAPREFSADEVFFVQSAANVVAAAMERRRAEAELQQTSARLRAVVDASPAVIYLKDLEGRLILANRRFEDLFGLPAGGGIGAPDRDLVDAATGELIAANDAAVAAAGEAMEFEERIPVDGEERVFISLKFPLRDAAGRIAGVGGVSTDVTERTRALAERAALEARVARAERLETVGQLAGGIAHDFNNLLAVIANYAGFLAQTVEPGSRAADDVEQILAASRGANELTRRLLLFSRRRAGNPEVVDLTTVVADTQQLLERALGEQIELRTAVEPGLWSVLADRSQLEQVLMNLAINARDAMPDGGALRIEARNVRLAPGEVQGLDGEAVEVLVADTGAGMPEEVLDRAFEPFFSTKPAAEGRGLGLATVYGIVRGAGGRVELRSGPGRGTAVIVHLPASRRAPAAGEAGEAADAAVGEGECVLVVEDKEAVRVLTERILRDAGYRVRTASDGGDALARLEADGDLDVLVTDVVMPGLSGQELADAVRERRPGLPVVFMSGYTEDHVVEDARRDGATAFVEKPFNAGELLRAVRGVLDEPGAGG
jgi:two-component system cell cycle sensor histidine kinase/response regulator CckA